MCECVCIMISYFTVKFDFTETTEPYYEIYSERESLAQIGICDDYSVPLTI